jgi:hypothetical protein
MKKLLWCGGSHLANSKSAIERIFTDSENTFFPTAGPVNREWFNSGGKYNVDGDLVVDPRDEGSPLHINQFSRVIFIGQFINIRFFSANSRPVSRALYESLYPYECVHLKGGLVNHPLELFFKEFGHKCILVPEPTPISNTKDSKIPLRTHDFYWEMLRKFCSHYDSILIEENPSFLGKDRLTLKIYEGIDSRHCNSRYWDIKIQGIKDVLNDF